MKTTNLSRLPAQESGPCFAHKGVYLVTCKLYSHGRVHLLFTVIVGKGGLDLSIAGLQAIHEWGHWCHGHRVMLDRIPHIRSVQVLPLMGYDLGGLLTVKYREICGHVDVHVVHGSLGQAAVGLRPCWGSPGPRVGTGAGAGSCAGLPGR